VTQLQEQKERLITSVEIVINIYLCTNYILWFMLTCQNRYIVFSNELIVYSANTQINQIFPVLQKKQIHSHR